jgi:hypothetical protein
MQSNSEYEHAVVVVEQSEKHGGEANDYYFNDESLPVDGFVEIRYPRDPENTDLESDWDAQSGQYWIHSIPYRDYRETDALWFARPDAEKWSRMPIWKWQNPPETEAITLEPSYGMKSDDGWNIHCYIRNGEVDLL